MRTLTIVLLSLLALVLSACGTSLTDVPKDSKGPALLTDSDLADAAPALATAEERVVLREGRAVPSGAETNLPDAAEFSAQAVLPNVSGYVAYTHFDGLSGDFQLWRANQSNDQKTLIYQGDLNINSVAVSKDGNVLVFAMNTPGGCCDIFRYVVSSGGLTNLTESPSQNHINVSMTADGKTLVWERLSGGKYVLSVRTYTSSTGPSFSQSTLSAPVSQTQASISGNGKFLTFMRYSGGKYRVMRLNRGTGALTQVTSSSHVLRHPSPSNGSTVAWIEDRIGQPNRLRVKNLSTGTLTNALSTGSYIDHAHLTADGKYLVYDRTTTLDYDTVYNLYTRNLSTGQQAKLVSDSHWFSGAYWQK